ncbi:MAG: sulfatase-like hydrolase/transferase [Lachnospiraceae bacterium]|nr:sulfatase-like hydrolase/transferase [Lachnospiraceae bacterium]
MKKKQGRKEKDTITEKTTGETIANTGEEQNQERKKHRLPHFLLFALVFMWDEILLRIFTETSLLSQLAFPLLSAAALGLFFGTLTSLFQEKINRVLTILILAVISVFFTVECVVRRTYQTYMTISSMLAGGGNVLGEFRSDLMTAIVHSLPVIFLFLLPVILYLIFGKKHLPAQKKGAVYSLRLLAVSVALCLLTVAGESRFSSVSRLFYEQYEYDTTTQAFGLISGTLLDFMYSLPGMKTVSFVSASGEEAPVLNESSGQESGFAETAGSGDTETASAGNDTQSGGAMEADDVVSDTQTSGETSGEGTDESGNSAEGAEAAESGGLEDSETAQANEDAEEAQEIDYGVNALDIDFDALIAAESNSNIIALHEYVSSLTPTSKNEYTGLFEGKNLIVITAEAFSEQVINEELTPTLYRLANEGIKFTDFYQPAWGGSTSTGEYSVLMGLIPTDGVNSMYETIGCNVYYTVGAALKREGYSTLAFHNGTYTVYRRNETHTNLGFDDFLTFGSGLLDIQSWSNYDVDTISAILDNYVDDQPFCWYWMTYSGHGSYKASDGRTTRNIEQVRAVLGDTYKDTTLYYFCYQMELEKALTKLVETLEEKGIADDTVIVICSDHYPYGLAKSASYGNSENYLLDLYQVDSYDFYTRDHNALIIWSGSIEGENITVDEPVMSVDILPTLLNLFGVEYDSRLLVGRDVFSDAEAMVIWPNHSFVTSEGRYNAATGEFVLNEGVEVDEDYLKRIKAIVSNKLSYSSNVFAYDYFNVIFGEDG